MPCANLANEYVSSLMPHDLENMPLDEFCDYIESEHHAYIRKTLRSIEPLLVNLANDEGKKFPFLVQVLKKFTAMADEMSVHIQKEASVLFPYIKRLSLYSSKKGPKPTAHFSSVSVPVQRMESDHDEAVQGFRLIRRMTNDYAIDGMSNAVKDVYKQLQEFEVYISDHIEIENKLLFRKAINLEAEMYDNR